MRGLVIEFVDVDDYRYTRFARPPCRLDRGLRIAAVEMQDSGARNPFAAQLFGRVKSSAPAKG